MGRWHWSAQPRQFLHAAPANPSQQRKRTFMPADTPANSCKKIGLPPRTSEAQRNPASRAPASSCQQLSRANSCQQCSPARSAPPAHPKGLRTSESLPAEQPSESQQLRCAQLSASQSQPPSSGASNPDVCFGAAKTSRGLGPAGSWAPGC